MDTDEQIEYYRQFLKDNIEELPTYFMNWDNLEYEMKVAIVSFPEYQVCG